MRRSSSFLFAAWSLALCALCPTLHAQSVPNDHFSVNHYVPAIGPGNYLQVDGAAIGKHLAPSAEVWLDYAHRPFVLYTATCADNNPDDCTLDKSRKDIIGNQLTINLAGTIALWGRLQIGLVVPLVYTHGDGFAASTPGFDQPYLDLRGGSAFGLGDPRLSAKVQLIGENNLGFLLAGAAYVTAPVGHAISDDHALGYDGPTAGLKAIAEYRWLRARIAANVGGEYRPERKLLSTHVGSDLYYGAAGAVDLTSLLSVIAEVAGSTRFNKQLDENPLEARLAARLTQGDFIVQLGGGLGLLSGVGIPNFRAIAGVGYQPAGLDGDGDGIGDQQDACPGTPEDPDHYLDEDGCPDDDNDQDGFPDASDKCPNDAEDKDGFQDQDGCPDRDNDADGIQDGYDSCPDQPEDKDGDRDQDGCPDNDRDRDGVEDDKDKCPDKPEDTDGFGDEDGCPEVDFDDDGIPDTEDQCPDEKEDRDGKADEDGCPE
ncbi:MAG: hypothetical protein RL701_4588 [Pseudomonadota bacterium]|jgi:hypothetical protein